MAPGNFSRMGGQRVKNLMMPNEKPKYRDFVRVLGKEWAWIHKFFIYAHMWYAKRAGNAVTAHLSQNFHKMNTFSEYVYNR